MGSVPPVWRVCRTHHEQIIYYNIDYEGDVDPMSNISPAEAQLYKMSQHVTCIPNNDANRNTMRHMGQPLFCTDYKTMSKNEKMKLLPIAQKYVDALLKINDDKGKNCINILDFHETICKRK